MNKSKPISGHAVPCEVPLEAAAKFAGVNAMSNPRQSNRFGRITIRVTIAILIALSVAAPFAYRYVARHDLNSDPFTYAQDGKEILAGRRLYSDIYFDKGPLAVVAFAIPQCFFPRDFLAIGAFLGMILVAQALIFAWGFRSNPPAVVVVALFTILFPMTSPSFIWLSTEHLANLFVVVDLVIAYKIVRLRSVSLLDCFLVGIITCLAVNIRQTAIFSGMVPATLWIVHAGTWNKTLKAFAFGLLGGVTGLVSMLMLVAIIGDVHQYLTMCYLYPAAYGAASEWTSVGRLFSEALSGPLPIFVAISVVCAVFSRYPAVVIPSVIAALLTCFSPRRDSTHYLIGAFPYMAFLIGVGLDRPTKFHSILSWALASYIICVCTAPAHDMLTGARDIPVQIKMTEIGAAIDRDAPPSATLLVWGPMGSEAIVFSSHLPTANKYWILWMLNYYSSGSGLVSTDRVISEYLANPPTVIAMDLSFVEHVRLGVKLRGYDEALRLGKLLLLKYNYVVTDSINGYDIAVLQNPDGIPGTATQTK